MELTVFDRIVLLNILSSENDITTLRIVRDLKARIGFTEEELAVLSFEKRDETGLAWKTNAVPAKDFEIGLNAHSQIMKAFEVLNKKKKMNFELLSVFEKFESKE